MLLDQGELLLAPGVHVNGPVRHILNGCGDRVRRARLLRWILPKRRISVRIDAARPQQFIRFPNPEVRAGDEISANLEFAILESCRQSNLECIGRDAGSWIGSLMITPHLGQFVLADECDREQFIISELLLFLRREWREPLRRPLLGLLALTAPLVDAIDAVRRLCDPLAYLFRADVLFDRFVQDAS